MSASSRGWHHRTYTVNSPAVGESGFEGRHKAGAYGNLMGLAGRGLAGHLRSGTCYEFRHPVD